MVVASNEFMMRTKWLSLAPIDVQVKHMANSWIQCRDVRRIWPAPCRVCIHSFQTHQYSDQLLSDLFWSLLMLQSEHYWQLHYCTGSLSLDSFHTRCPFLLLVKNHYVMYSKTLFLNLGVVLLLYSLFWWQLFNKTLLSLRYIVLSFFCTFFVD